MKVSSPSERETRLTAPGSSCAGVPRSASLSKRVARLFLFRMEEAFRSQLTRPSEQAEGKTWTRGG